MSQAKFNAVHILRSAQSILSHLNKSPNDTHKACTAPDDHASAQFCPHPRPLSTPSPHASLLCLANLQDYCPSWDKAPAFLGCFLLMLHTDVFLSFRFDWIAVVCWHMFSYQLSGERKPWLIAFAYLSKYNAVDYLKSPL